MDEEWAVDIVFLSFSKHFDIVFHKIIIEKLLSMGLADSEVDWKLTVQTGPEWCYV